MSNNKGQIKFLNLYGDITIEWDEEDHEKMLKIIQDKLDDGFQFYIVKKKFLGIPGTDGVKKLKNSKKINDRKVIIKDNDISKYFNGVTSARQINDDVDTHEVVKNSTSPEEIVKSSSVCTKQPTRG